MSGSNLVIFGEILLVFLGGAAFLFYQLNKLNDQLQLKSDSLKDKLKDEKRHSKGLRVKIQDQNKNLAKLQNEIKQQADDSVPQEKKLKKLEKNRVSLESKIAALQKENDKLTSDLSKSKKLVESSNKTINQLKSEQVSQNNNSDDYEELYFDLKNSIAYNMTGGDQVLDTLRERLRENGNVEEGEKLAELKERYNSLGGMVGVVSEVEIFIDNDDHKDESEEEKIEYAEGLVSSAKETLKQAELLGDASQKDLDESQQQVGKLGEELNKTLIMNNKLRNELDKTSTQLNAFINKARMFQAQKEQIKMHKATQNQMHRNFVNLSSDYKKVSRRFKSVESKNEILNVQLANSSDDPEVLVKLDGLREQLEEKEKIMDRLVVEKEMVEQQFLSMSEESQEEHDSSQALDRLQSEHQLLEQQFLDVLSELDTDKSDIIKEQVDI